LLKKCDHTEERPKPECVNVAFRGPLNDEIYQLATSPFLKAQLKITSERSSAYREMADAEFVLRFLTLNPRVDDFSGSLVREMDQFMVDNRYLSGFELSTVRRSFIYSLERCETLWGDKAFRRPESSGWRDQTLAGMYDAQMIAVASLRLSEEEFDRAAPNRGVVIQRTRDLFDDQEFETAVRSGTNTPNRIKYRVRKMRDSLVF
jgi:hypothetical protein